MSHRRHSLALAVRGLPPAFAAGVGYEFNDKISAVAGYRALGVDYSSDDLVFDVVQKGPILGLVGHFWPFV